MAKISLIFTFVHLLSFTINCNNFEQKNQIVDRKLICPA